MAFECMEDCIHLKACRRVQAIGKKHRLLVPRYCTKDCTAYVSGEVGNYISVEDAIGYAREGANSIRSGYDCFDVYVSGDLSGLTLGEIVENQYED